MRIFTLVVYILIGLFIAWFASNNFGRVQMWLPGGYEANWPFAVYLIAALLLGALPLSVMHSVSRWRWKRKVKKLETELAAREPIGTAYDSPATLETSSPLSSV